MLPSPPPPTHSLHPPIYFIPSFIHSTEHKFLHALETLYQSGASAASLERRDRTTLVGSFASGGTPYTGYARGGRPSQFPYKYSYPAVAAPVATAKAAESEEDGGEEAEEQEEEEDGVGDRCVPIRVCFVCDVLVFCLFSLFSLSLCDCDSLGFPLSVTLTFPPSPSSLPTRSREKKKRSADKTEARKQFVVLVERAGTLWRSLEAARKKANASNSNTNATTTSEPAAGAADSAGPPPINPDRPSQAEMFTLLKEFTSLPNLELPPGGTYVLCGGVSGRASPPCLLAWPHIITTFFLLLI